tara:strand:- start:724 stop:1011 length:288 start_codon:yes stop_codon:yes gene_type:complete
MNSFKISKARLKEIILEEQMALEAETLEEKAKSTKKYDDNPKLKGDQDELPDQLQKAIIDKEGGDADEDDEEEKNENLDLQDMVREEILKALRGE